MALPHQFVNRNRRRRQQRNHAGAGPFELVFAGNRPRGRGEKGAAALKEFAEQGGTCINPARSGWDNTLTAHIGYDARSAADKPLSGGVFYEVGPGPGGLTRGLLSEGADKVIAVERDGRCLPALEEVARAWPGQLEGRR